MSKFVSFFLFLLLSVLSLGAQSYQSAQTTAYIEQFHKIAIREMYLYKIPASITLAQGILESGSGRSDLAERANNHFGIKCPGDYSGKGYYKNDDKRNECFRVYKNAEESFRDHSIFLTKPRYADLFKLSETDYKGWAKGLKKAGYATNTKYPQLLIDIIEQNKLYEYDKNPERYLAKDESRRTKSLNVIAPNPAKVSNSERVSPPTLKRNKVNGIKCLQVKQGDTFYGLSKKAGLTIAELRHLNDMSEDHVLQVGEYLFLEPKKKKNKEHDGHYVREGDTWYSISQLYGIRKANLMKMNSKHRYLTVGITLRLN